MTYIPKPQVSLARAAETLKCFCGLQNAVVLSAEEMDGYEDTNFYFKVKDSDGQVQKYVMKVHNAESANKGDYRKALRAVLTELNSKGICCPRPILPASGEGNVDTVFIASQSRTNEDQCLHAVSLFGYVPGKELLQARQTAGLWTSLGVFLGRMHQVLQGMDFPAFHYECEWHLSQAPEAIKNHASAIGDTYQRSVYLEVADELANVLRHVGDTLPRQLVHTDANESNVLVDESDTQILGIIDFGEMNVGHRAMDVAHAMAYQMAFSRGDRMEPAVCILKGYLSVNPLLPTEIDVLPVMIMGRMAQSIVLGAYSAAQDPSNESYIMDGKDGMWAVVQHIREVGPGKMADMLKAAVQSENENVES